MPLPLKVTVPLFAVKVPALDQLPATFIFAVGAVSVLDTAISRLLNELVLPPLIAVVPLNVTVPLFALKVPALAQLPLTFMFALGAVKLLDEAMLMLLKESVPAPLIAVVPSKVTVPPLPLKVPALPQLPATFIFAAGAVSELDAAISRLLKELILAPVIAVVPSKVTVLPFEINVPALDQLPPMAIASPLALSVPAVMVKLPLTVIPPFKV